VSGGAAVGVGPTVATGGAVGASVAAGPAEQAANRSIRKNKKDLFSTGISN
jgi:hypothetical protein